MRMCWILLLAGAALPAAAQIAPGDCTNYARDLAGNKYSPLDQIPPDNVTKLLPLWTFSPKVDPTTPPLTPAVTPLGTSAATPIVVSGVMYLPAGKRVVALDGVTGAEIWSYALPSGVASQRGVAYWPGDKQNPPRVLFTTGSKMVALNAGTGKLDPGFGKEGEVDIGVPYSGVPTVY